MCSSDLTGSIKYTVKTATPQVVQVAPSTAAPAMPAGNAQPSAPPNDESASPAAVWPWVLGALLLVVAAVVLVRLNKRGTGE